MAEHTIVAFDTDLDAIKGQVASMAAMIRRQVADAMAALVTRDSDLARSVVAQDVGIDALLQAIETKVIETVARRQPLAIDLREMVAAFHISHDLERAGDLAKGIAKRVIALDGDLPKDLVAKAKELSSLVLECLTSVTESYREGDDLKAAAVWNRDQEIDAAQNALFADILVCMISDPRSISPCTHLLFCVKNLERMGDHATNIAESVHFIATGERFAGDRPRPGDINPALVPQ